MVSRVRERRFRHWDVICLSHIDAYECDAFDRIVCYAKRGQPSLGHVRTTIEWYETKWRTDYNRQTPVS